jgi:hypothetical protein
MEAKKISERQLTEFYETARQSFVAKMKTEDDERSNLKFRIAAFVIQELSHSTPSWFQGYFLSSIPGYEMDTDIEDQDVAGVENAFHDAIAAYLIKLESEVDYVKEIFSRFTKDGGKKDYWKPILADAFLIVGIYFAPLSESWIHQRNLGGKHTKNTARPVRPDHAFIFG